MAQTEVCGYCRFEFTGASYNILIFLSIPLLRDIEKTTLLQNRNPNHSCPTCALQHGVFRLLQAQLPGFHFVQTNITTKSLRHQGFYLWLCVLVAGKAAKSLI